MSELSIKVVIGGRQYPLKIERNEEENVRKAVKVINERLKDFEQNYTVKDKQDLLAMCCIQFATQNINLENKTVIEDEGIVDRLVEIEQFVSDYLKKDAAVN